MAYDDGPDYGALVQFSDSETVEASFLEESSTVDCPSAWQLAGARGTGARGGIRWRARQPGPAAGLPAEASRTPDEEPVLQPRRVLRAEARRERGEGLDLPLDGRGPPHRRHTLLDVRSSFLETDALGRTVQVNKVCCGGAANAGGAGPGGDQFAAASVPAVPCGPDYVIGSLKPPDGLAELRCDITCD